MGDGVGLMTTTYATALLKGYVDEEGIGSRIDSIRFVYPDCRLVSPIKPEVL